MEKLRLQKADTSQDGDEMAVKLLRPGVRRLLLWDEVRIAGVGAKSGLCAVEDTPRLSTVKG